MYCKKCGRELYDDASFCDNCGAQLDVNKKKGIVKQPPMKKKSGCISSLLKAIVVVFLIFFAVSQFRSPISKQSTANTSTTTSAPVSTSAPIATPAPKILTTSELIKTAVAKEFKPSSSSATKYDESTKYLHIVELGSDNLTSYFIRIGMWSSMFDIMKALKDTDVDTIEFDILLPLVDTYGNTFNGLVMRATFPKEVRNKVNWDNMSYSNIPIIAENYWQHAAITDS